MKAVITGGTGFIGSRLVERLVEKGYEVRCLVRKSSQIEPLKKLGVELCYGDLLDHDSLRSLTKGGDLVFHLAAMVTDWGSKRDFYTMNVDATRVLLEGSRDSGVKRFIYMSSSTVVWKSDFWEVHDINDIDESYPYPERYNDYYNETKAEAERAVISFHKGKGLETVVLRPSNVWGAGDRVILPRIVQAAKKGILFPMGSGHRWVSPCHVDNLAHALVLSAESANLGGNIYFINDGVKIEHIEFLTKLLGAARIEWVPKFTIPYTIAYGVAYAMETLFRIVNSQNPPVLTRFAVAALAGSRSYSIEKAKREIGYKPIINMDEGLRQLADWIRGIGGIERLLKN
ncbi:MAG: NAD-dependent epimerase/dehydratase family protein [Thermodesulfobacteriota bacterium]